MTRYFAIALFSVLFLAACATTRGGTTFSRQDAELQAAANKAEAEAAAIKKAELDKAARQQALSAQADEACKAAYWAALRGDEKLSAKWAERCTWLYCMSQLETYSCGMEVPPPVLAP